MTTHHERAALVAEAREESRLWDEFATMGRTLGYLVADREVGPVDIAGTAELLWRLGGTIDRLATALEAAAKDTERLEELERLAREHGYVKVCHGGEVSDGFWLSRGEYWGICPSLGEAIDAARASAAVPDEAAEGR